MVERLAKEGAKGLLADEIVYSGPEPGEEEEVVLG